MDIIMPKMGESISEGTILKWHKKKGDAVKRDEIIFEISTDKVDTEIPAAADGIISEIVYNEGDTVDVGTVVAILDTGSKVKEEVSQNTAGTVSHVQVDSKKEEPALSKHVYYSDENRKEEIPLTVKPVDKSNGAGEIIEITMPKMGETVLEGTIIKWYKKAGDRVKKDETIFEISTDKVDTDVPANEDGVITEILVGEQETVEVGTAVARLSKRIDLPAAVEKELAEKTIHKPAPAGEGISNEPLKEGSKFLSPLVMNILRKENISYDEINKIRGTGLEGRITKKDLFNYIENKKNEATEPVEVKTAEPVLENITGTGENTLTQVSKTSANIQALYSSNEVERIPMDNIRQKIMQHMINSRDTSVHVSAMLEADVTRIYNFLKNNRDDIQKKEGVKLTYMPFIAHACIKALREFPLVNATLDGYTIIKKKYINLGIAVAVDPAGLIVPNIKNADEKNIFGLARSYKRPCRKSKNKETCTG